MAFCLSTLPQQFFDNKYFNHLYLGLPNAGLSNSLAGLPFYLGETILNLD